MKTQNTSRHIAKWLAPSLLLLLLNACSGPDTSGTNKTDTVATVTQAQTDATLKPASPPANFKHQTALVNGVNIHYVIGGQGEPLVLVHGFGQNWYMWNRLLPELSKHFTVIAPDLRGVGESDKPATDMIKRQWQQMYTSWLNHWALKTSISPVTISG